MMKEERSRRKRIL